MSPALIFALTLLPLPALAWEFSYDGVCRLTHQAADAEFIVTFDPGVAEYALIVTLRDGVWPQDPRFNLSFYGNSPATLVTGNHTVATDGAMLTVRDRGFGNVLDGIEMNVALAASSGTTVVGAETTNAAPAVQAFRACPAEDPATS